MESEQFLGFHLQALFSRLGEEARAEVPLPGAGEDGDDHLASALVPPRDLQHRRRQGRADRQPVNQTQTRKKGRRNRSRVCYTLRQAAKLAPEEMPTRRPSSAASLRACTMASSELTVTTSSISAVSRLWVRKPGPIPWISCFPGEPPAE